MENLYLKWQDYKTGNKLIIGALCRDKEKNKYYFKLNENYMKKAEEQSEFSPAMVPFSDVNRIYESNQLFPFFKIRVPKVEKMDEEDIKDLLEEFQMKEFDEFEFLKKSKGDIITDNFILEEEKDN